MLVRHAYAEGPHATVNFDELCRAFEVGESLQALPCDMLVHTALIRTAMTGAAVMNGIKSLFTVAPAIPELGNDLMFKELTAPEGFRDYAKEHGNFAAVLEKHGTANARVMATKMANALDEAVFQKANDGERWLICCHSPTIEMLCWAFADYPTSNAIREELTVIEPLDVVRVKVDVGDGGQWEAVFGEKFTAQPRKK